MNQITECCICMDDIIGNTNKTTTECGHIFHCSCLMKNTTHNGYGCPYCRTVMAEEVIDEDSEEDYEDEMYYEDDTASDNVLTSFRMFHQRNMGEEIEEEEEDEDAMEPIPIPSPEYISQTLIEHGITYEDLVKCLLVDHSEYENDEQYEKKSDKLFGRMRRIISNYPE
jgi:hypothetical protein